MPRFGQNYYAPRLFADYAFADGAFSDMSGMDLRVSIFTREARQVALDGASAGSAATFESGTGFALQGAGGPIASSVIGVGPDAAGDSGRPDNYQPVESAWNIPGPNALVDVYTADENTTGTLAVDGAHVIAASDVPGDNDWFAVTLTAGETYEFGQYAYAGHVAGVEGSGVPLADAFLELYDADGNLLSLADGGGPNTPNGLDALMTFEATYSGTYYVNATSYDNDGDGIGDFVGDYELFARVATGLSYSSEYDISSPLHSIDWGGVRVNREHVAVENPDGAEGPRPTGDPAADPAEVEGNFLGYPGKNVIYLYFGGEGDIYAHPDSTIPAQVVIQDPYQYEVQAMLTAANEFSKVADVVFVSNYTFNSTTGLWERDESIEYKPGPTGPEPGKKYAAGVDGDGFDADFFYFSYPGTPGPVISLLGSMNPPDYADEGVAQFNSADERWTAQMLQPGGFSFYTLIHEFGHGMGLAHPHDTGGGSSVMPGVNPLVPGDDGGKGTHGLNQGVFTMMSYNDGWEESPYGLAETNNEGYGWLGSLMALDIAVIQDKYGVNEEWATGDNTYVLKDVNEWGVYIDAATGQQAQHGPDDAATSRDGYYQGQSTFYSSIWDAGGVDEIVYNGSRNASINLRPASLKYEPGGGGWVSYAYGIHGGYTIANGVTIENATGGSGNDQIRGNSANNRLDGRAGNDILYLMEGGDDNAIGGDGADLFLLGATLTGADLVDGGIGRDQMAIQGNYAGLTLGTGVVGLESIAVLSGADQRFDDPGTNFYDYNLTTVDQNVAFGVQMIVDASGLRVGEDFTFNGAAETDGSFFIYGGQGVDTLTGGSNHDAFYFGEGLQFGSGDVVNGGPGGTDQLGLRGSYTIVFGAGQLVGIENIGMVSAHDTRYGPQGANYNYNLTMNDGNAAAGAQLTIDAFSLRSGESLTFNGAAETDGTYRVFGGQGHDNIVGGQGNDTLAGNRGADNLTGGGGADTFRYNTAADSSPEARDHIHDFAPGIDKIDLTRIDADTNTAGDQAFHWIGANAFTGTGAGSAGELRAYLDNGNWFIEGDTDGNGVADLRISMTAPATAIGAGDFFL